MSVGFFVTVSRTELSTDRIQAAFVGHTQWDLDGGKREIDLQGRNYRVICLEDAKSGSSTIWKEKDRPDFQGSFVLVLGWCYRISTFSDSLGADDYRLMVDRFCADKPPLSDDFGGQFVAIVYDSKRQRLAVQPDRLASGAAFFATSNGEFASSNRALRLANYFGTPIDGHSVMAQMRGTHMPFGRTLFAGVRRLMGSEYLEFDFQKGVAQVSKPYSRFVPTREISYGDSVDVVADTVRTTVRRILSAGPVQFDLTGGNDTRAVASAVESITGDHGNGNGNSNGNAKFRFRVSDPEGSGDVTVARRIADSCGWSIVRLGRNPSAEATVEELARAATGGDGNFPVNAIWGRVDSERFCPGYGQWKANVGGSAGEIFRGYFYAQEMLALGRTSKVNYDALLAYRTYASRGVEMKLFATTSVTLEENDKALLAPYRAIGDEGGSISNPYKLDLMYLQRHCYRSGNVLSWLFGFLNLRLPFLSWELTGLALSLPWKYRANRGLMQRVIGKLSPKLANIPNVDGEPMKPLSLATFPAYVAAKIPMGLDRGGRVVRRILGRSAGSAAGRLPVAPQAAYFAVLDNAKFIPGIFDPAIIKRVRAMVQSGQNSKDNLVMFYQLCTIELLLQEAHELRHQLVFD